MTREKIEGVSEKIAIALCDRADLSANLIKCEQRLRGLFPLANSNILRPESLSVVHNCASLTFSVNAHAAPVMPVHWFVAYA